MGKLHALGFLTKELVIGMERAYNISEENANWMMSRPYPHNNVINIIYILLYLYCLVTMLIFLLQRLHLPTLLPRDVPCQTHRFKVVWD